MKLHMKLEAIAHTKLNCAEYLKNWIICSTASKTSGTTFCMYIDANRLYGDAQTNELRLDGYRWDQQQQQDCEKIGLRKR